MVIGGKGLKEGNVEVKWRTGSDGPEMIPVENAVPEVLERLAERRKAEAANVPE